MVRYHQASFIGKYQISSSSSLFAASHSPSFFRDLIDDEADIAVAPLSVTKGRAEVTLLHWTFLLSFIIRLVCIFTFHMFIIDIIMSFTKGRAEVTLALKSLIICCCFFKKIVVMYLYSIFVFCVIKGRAEMMTFALKLLHKERLNPLCFRHSTSFNRCLSF